MQDDFLKNPQFLPEVLDTMRDGLMVVDNAGCIRIFNRAAEDITGYKGEDVLTSTSPRISRIPSLSNSAPPIIRNAQYDLLTEGPYVF